MVLSDGDLLIQVKLFLLQYIFVLNLGFSV